MSNTVFKNKVITQDFLANWPSSVNSIEPYQFSDGWTLDPTLNGEIRIPDCIYYIGTRPFPDTTTKVILGANVYEINQMPYNLNEIVFNNNIAFLNYGTFQSTKITSITLPDTVRELGKDNIFQDCYYLTTVVLHNKLVDISGSNIFNGCTNLATVTGMENLRKIGNYTFNRCSSLPSVLNLPVIEILGQHAFQECNSLVTVNIGPELEKLDGQAFSMCNSLTTVNIGDANAINSLTNIGSNTFAYSPNLATINIYAPKSQVTTTSSAPWGAPSTCQVNWLGGE